MGLRRINSSLDPHGRGRRPTCAYVLTEGADGLGNDDRIGSSGVMAGVEAVGTPTGVDGLYDLQGLADELRAL